MIEFFLSVPLRDGRAKIFRAFKHSELSDWAAHGADVKRPFGDRSAWWRVSHIRSGWGICGHVKLTRAQALRLAAVLDAAHEGAGQISMVPGKPELIGWDGEVQSAIREAVDCFLAAEGLPPRDGPLTAEQRAALSEALHGRR